MIACLLSALLVNHVSATVLREVPIEELTTSADVIVVAIAGASRFIGATPDEVRTCTALTVLEQLKGLRTSTVEVCERGGVAGNGLTLHIEGTPQFEAGQSVLVFLSQRADGSFRTRGFSQGIFRITARNGERYAERDLSHVAFAEPSTSVVREGRAIPTTGTLRQLLAYVRNVLTERAQ